jgi:hypothetical protein
MVQMAQYRATSFSSHTIPHCVSPAPPVNAVRACCPTNLRSLCSCCQGAQRWLSCGTTIVLSVHWLLQLNYHITTGAPW